MCTTIRIFFFVDTNHLDQNLISIRVILQKYGDFGIAVPQKKVLTVLYFSGFQKRHYM